MLSNAGDQVDHLEREGGSVVQYFCFTPPLWQIILGLWANYTVRFVSLVEE